jgi:hypothetical protein
MHIINFAGFGSCPTGWEFSYRPFFDRPHVLVLEIWCETGPDDDGCEHEIHITMEPAK